MKSTQNSNKTSKKSRMSLLKEMFITGKCDMASFWLMFIIGLAFGWGMKTCS